MRYRPAAPPFGHIGQPAKPQRHIPNQTQPAVFWRAFACALAGCAKARQAAFGEVWAPSLPQSARLLPASPAR
ncbi:hypothetical protein J4734_24935 [Klebsiella pneumoniae]|uniref:Uncharacterized protein n=1 Tax=Klebsiella pneumoniae TaxID=573 RepID=A0A939SSP7_KLEPN|nr:hypothetical protein [Klebsiella pneumoniae]